MIPANDDDVQFAFENDLNLFLDAPTQKPSINMCEAYQRGACALGSRCPDRHVKSDYRTLQPRVCKYWLRGACTNGADCHYLHAFETRLIPECAFYAKFGVCTNPECNYRHTPPDERTPLCAAYLRGFCPLGPECRYRHQRLPTPCPFYMQGFCPLGPRCHLGPHPVQQLHDRFSVHARLKRKMIAEAAEQQALAAAAPGTDDASATVAAPAGSSTNERAAIGGAAMGGFSAHDTCHRCLDPGHKASACPGPSSGRYFAELRRVREPGEADVFDSTDGRSLGCFICSDPSHNFTECPHRETEQGRQLLGRVRRGPPGSGLGPGMGGAGGGAGAGGRYTMMGGMGLPAGYGGGGGGAGRMMMRPMPYGPAAAMMGYDPANVAFVRRQATLQSMGELVGGNAW